MKPQFDKNQQYQLDAIQAVIDLFEGQDKVKTNAQLKMEDNGITFKTVNTLQTVCAKLAFV